MDARRAVRQARQKGRASDEARAHKDVDAAKRELGERGPTWWTDGAPDLNRHLARTTLYRDWFEALPASDPNANSRPGSRKAQD